MRQLKLLLPLYEAARHVELDGVAGEALQAPRSIIPGCAFATTLLQLLLVGPLQEVRAGHPTVSIRVVVDHLSLQRFGDHNRVTQELERASTCTAAKLMQAGCEIATMMSKVLSNSICVAAGTAAAAWRAGVADRTKPRNRFRVRETSNHSGATGGWRSPKDVSGGSRKSTANRRCHGGDGWRKLRMLQCQQQTITGWRSLGSMKRSCSSPGRRWRLAWQSGCMGRAQQWCT